jgi:hypothetical protein
VPNKIHTILPDNGIQFTNRKRGQDVCLHIFDRVSQEYASDHRLTKTIHPWTNGQVEWVNARSKKLP